jgi:hypothetical protein
MRIDYPFLLRQQRISEMKNDLATATTQRIAVRSSPLLCQRNHDQW